MGERNYKVNEPIKFVYQAPGRESGLMGIVAEIFLPNEAKDSDFPDVSMTEIGNKGVYVGTFTPDALGEWTVVVHKSGDEGQVVKKYSVGSYDVTGVGVAVEDVEGKVDAVDAGVDAVQSTIDGVNSQLDVVEAKVESIETKVDNLDTPPMIS